MTLSADKPPEATIREEIDRILASEGFAHSPRITAFLSYVVNEKLTGRGDYLKEYRIALDVFGREADFDPQTNPIARVLVVVTARPEFSCSWNVYPHVTSLALDRLVRPHCQELILNLTGGVALTSDLETQIVAKTDGVPLFVEELTKTMLDMGLLQEYNGRYELRTPLSQTTIPDTLQDSLIARLDLLEPAKEAAQTVSTIGRKFTYDLLAQISGLEEMELQAALDKLVDSGLIFQRGTLPQAKFSFKQALIRDTAYTSLLKNQRRQLHARLVKVLESDYPELMETDPELTAHHLTQAGHNRRAIEQWEKAGRRAIARSANPEAIQHLTQALELLRTLPDDGKRLQHELKLLISLDGAQMIAKGYAAAKLRTPTSEQRNCVNSLVTHPNSCGPCTVSLCFGLYVGNCRRDVRLLKGIAEQSQGIAIFQGTGACLALTLFLSTLAESFGSACDPEEGMRNIEKALAVAKTGEEYFWEPELYRIKANLLLAAENSKSDVEACYQQAIDSAVMHQMKSLELRAVMGLSHLWMIQRKKKKARERLEQIYGWFPQGFDMPDLKEAKVVLEVLH